MEKKIRLVAFDLDGTTLNSNGKLSERNRCAMEKADAAGVYMVPATGRVLNFLPASLTELPFLRYAITANGAAVWDLHTNTCVGDHLISTEAALEAQKVFDKFDLYVEYYVNGSSVTLTGNPERARTVLQFPKEKFYFLSKDYLYVDDFSRWLRQERIRPEKINLMYIPEDVRESFFGKIQKVPGLSLTYSNVDNMEINAEGCDKGTGLRALCTVLGLRAEETMAVGDNGNDLGMLRAAGFAVVVANGIEEAKAEADAVVADYREDGFAQAVERFVL